MDDDSLKRKVKFTSYVRLVCIYCVTNDMWKFLQNNYSKKIYYLQCVETWKILASNRWKLHHLLNVCLSGRMDLKGNKYQIWIDHVWLIDVYYYYDFGSRQSDQLMEFRINGHAHVVQLSISLTFYFFPLFFCFHVLALRHHVTHTHTL